MASHHNPKEEGGKEDKKPYLVFKLCSKWGEPDHKENCGGCGYFWGPGHATFSGQPATWSGPGNAGGVGRVK